MNVKWQNNRTLLLALSVTATAVISAWSVPTAKADTKLGWPQNPGFTTKCPKAKAQDKYACDKHEKDVLLDDSGYFNKLMEISNKRSSSDDYKSETVSIDAITANLAPACREVVLDKVFEFEGEQLIAQYNNDKLPQQRQELTNLFNHMDEKVEKLENGRLVLKEAKEMSHEDMVKALDSSLELSKLHYVEKQAKNADRRFSEGYGQLAKLESAKAGVHNVSFYTLVQEDDTIFLETTTLEVNNKKKQGYKTFGECKTFWTNKAKKEGCGEVMSVLTEWQKQVKVVASAADMKKNPRACDAQVQEAILGCGTEQFAVLEKNTSRMPLAAIDRESDAKVSGFTMILPKFKDQIAQLEETGDVSSQSRFSYALSIMERLDDNCELTENAAAIASEPVEVAEPAEDAFADAVADDDATMKGGFELPELEALEAEMLKDKAPAADEAVKAE